MKTQKSKPKSPATSKSFTKKGRLAGIEVMKKYIDKKWINLAPDVADAIYASYRGLI